MNCRPSDLPRPSRDKLCNPRATGPNNHPSSPISSTLAMATALSTSWMHIVKVLFRQKLRSAAIAFLMTTLATLAAGRMRQKLGKVAKALAARLYARLYFSHCKSNSIRFEELVHPTFVRKYSSRHLELPAIREAASEEAEPPIRAATESTAACVQECFTLQGQAVVGG